MPEPRLTQQARDAQAQAEALVAGLVELIDPNDAMTRHRDGILEESLQGFLVQAARDCALVTLVELLDPSGSLANWARAGKLAERLQRFETAYQRIEAGHREPTNVFEWCLVAVRRAEGGASQRRLYDRILALGLTSRRPSEMWRSSSSSGSLVSS
jgi:hypothetical protein